MFRDVRRKLPSLEITINTGHTREVVQAVEDTAVDVGFVTLPAAGRMLGVTPVYEDRFVFIAAPERTDLPDQVTPELASRLPLLLTKPVATPARSSMPGPPKRAPHSARSWP